MIVAITNRRPEYKIIGNLAGSNVRPRFVDDAIVTFLLLRLHIKSLLSDTWIGRLYLFIRTKLASKLNYIDMCVFGMRRRSRFGGCTNGHFLLCLRGGIQGTEYFGKWPHPNLTRTFDRLLRRYQSM